MDKYPLEICWPGRCTRAGVFVELLLSSRFGLRLGIL